MATADVSPLGKYLSEVREIRKRWKVPKNNELWFRAEDSSHRKTHLQPGLYRPKANGTKLPSTSSLLKLENHLYEEFSRMGTQLSDARSLSDDWEWDSYFLMQHHGVPTRLLDWSDGALVALHFGKRVVFPSGVGTGPGLTIWSWFRQRERKVVSGDFVRLQRSGALSS